MAQPRRCLGCRGPGWLTKSLAAVALVALIAQAQTKALAQVDVGEIVSRPSPMATQAAMSVLQKARGSVQKRLANIAAQADPLADAVSAYKASPTVENALALLKREAVVGSIGAQESDAIAEESAAVARTCAGLAAQTREAVDTLRPGLVRANHAQAENASAREAGFAELRELHRELSARGVTNETAMSPAERRKVAMLLRLTGSARLSEQFLKMEVGATDAVINRLIQMTEQFNERQRDFEDLAKAYQLHAASFRTVSGSVAHVAQLIEINGRLDGEARTAADLQRELASIDDVLGKTFESLPEDFTPVFAPNGHDDAPNHAASTGLWARLLRFLGLSGSQAPEVVQAREAGGNP